ncbi:type I restriction enzyme M protein [Halopolyspora algeriensis]|uniref:Type I restriction enzyme M protein n=1 Tax=Halopolyspora algeriensis TaxID=1500506 RepID=A0A368W580_9ACTN|nr:N-6 DNA methylase [Halopolyspora algeriensis]RCW47210.1 type I restriction enzyme M protein [Halopolyspora algeriensis]TQM48295.1 type I restriction enzyme M protein [Halopolyspora algeriensis]
MTTSEGHISMADIARLAEVKPAAVSNWRRRSPGFPDPANTVDGEQFAVDDVAAWLDGRKIPKNALKAGEPLDAEYGQRFRRNLDSAGIVVPRQPNAPETSASKPGDFLRGLWQELDGYRNYLEAPFYRDLVLGLLYLRVHDTFRWRELAVASSRGEPQRIREVLTQATDDHRSTLPDLVDPAQLESHAQATGLADIVHLLNQVQPPDAVSGTDTDAHRLFEFLLERLATTDRFHGEFHTPYSVVRTMVELVEPRTGERIHDPCCGTGSLLTGVVKFVREHGGSASELSVSGHALTESSRKLAAMNLSVHGADAELGPGAVHALHDAPEGDHDFDVIVSNPPFAMQDWFRGDPAGDPRWRYGTPPKDRANFAWLQHSIAALAPEGRAAMLMPEGASFRRGREREIRAAMVEAGAVEAVVALPGQLFKATGISVSVWVLKKPEDKSPETVFLLDATGMGRMVERTRRALADEEIERIADLYRKFRAGSATAESGLCRAVPIAEIREHEYLLSPRGYLSDAAAEVTPSNAATATRAHRNDLVRLSNLRTSADTEAEHQLNRISSRMGDDSEPWEQVTLGEVCDVLSGPGGAVGKKFEYSAGGTSVIKPKNIRDNRLITEDVDKVDPDTAERWSRYRLAAGDVLCVRTGTLGRQALVDAEHAGALLGTACFRLRPRGPITGRYLTYWLGTPPAQDWIAGNAPGTTVPSLNARMLRSMPVALPPLRTQEAIGEILGALDDKIAVYERIEQSTAELRDSLTALLGTGTFPLDE